MSLPPLPQGYEQRPWDYKSELFIESQMLVYGTQCWNAAIEAAARVCETVSQQSALVNTGEMARKTSATATSCAALIKELTK